jgi:GNAT superfamily N-acetyltransferase
MATAASAATKSEVHVRPLQQDDLETADHLFRLAFGTFLGLPDPMAFYAGADYVRTRWTTDPTAAFGAEVDGDLVGSNFATNWGSVGFFGPLTICPDMWDKGIGKSLMEPIMDSFTRWGTRHTGLFTFAHSQKHVGLYQKFGFWPRFLTAIMSKAVDRSIPGLQYSKYSDLAETERDTVLRECCELTDALYEGLDVSAEIKSIDKQQIGDTVLLFDGEKLVGLALCHCGQGSEAGPDNCYLKFAAARPGAKTGESFERLLDACELFAAERGLSRLTAGLNLAREPAFRQLKQRGFRTDIQGVAMHRPNEPGYSRPDCFVIDDWR